jgi:hypothetical protein
LPSDTDAPPASVPAPAPPPRHSALVRGMAWMALGGLLLVMGLLIFSGLDRTLEVWLIDVSPMWLTELTTRY